MSISATPIWVAPGTGGAQWLITYIYIYILDAFFCFMWAQICNFGKKKTVARKADQEKKCNKRQRKLLREIMNATGTVP